MNLNCICKASHDKYKFERLHHGRWRITCKNASNAQLTVVAYHYNSKTCEDLVVTAEHDVLIEAQEAVINILRKEKVR